MTQEEFIGVNSIRFLSEILARVSARNIFLVTGKKSYTTSGAQQWVSDHLTGKVTITHLQDFETNPKMEDIQRGIALMEEHPPDAVVAIGGGSVLDTAKIINALAFQGEEPRAYIVEKRPMKPVQRPLIAVPTTAGTGSEATRFAAVYVDKTKYSLKHDSMLPRYAIVDPRLTASLPPSITAETGMDALCQAVESYWNIHSNDASKFYAVRAIRLALEHLPVAATHPTPVSREGMSVAANLAGKAINITETTACHAISYPMTSYFDVPHGQAVALTLAEMLEYNSRVTDADLLDDRGVEYVRRTIDEIVHLLGAADVQSAKHRIYSFMKAIGLATTLGELHIGEEGLEIIMQHGFNPERVKNNPRVLTREALRNILAQLL